MTSLLPKLFNCIVLLFLIGMASCTTDGGNAGKTTEKTAKPKQEVQKKTPDQSEDKVKPKPKKPAEKKPTAKPKPKPPAPRPEVPTIAKHNINALSDGDFIKTMLKMVNDQRKAGCKCGSKNYSPARKLKWNGTLQKIAHTHSLDMARMKKMSHSGSDGSDVDERLDNGGYNWMGYGENVAFGQRTIQEVFSGWIESPPHCRNIMNPALTEIGVSQAGLYWTMILATPNEPLM
ncbi:MAG: CAP domain-containing protein [Bacteroidota bacterium]